MKTLTVCSILALICSVQANAGNPTIQNSILTGADLDDCLHQVALRAFTESSIPGALHVKTAIQGDTTIKEVTTKWRQNGEALVVGVSIEGTIHTLADEDLPIKGQMEVLLEAPHYDKYGRQIAATQCSLFTIEGKAQINMLLKENVFADDGVDLNGFHPMIDYPAAASQN